MTHFGPINSIKRLSTQAEALAAGDVTLEISEGDRVDEVGQLKTSFSKTKRYLQTITDQAEKIAQREFDDEALDEEVPGPVGESMVNMRDDLEQFLEERKQREQRLKVFNRILRHNLRNRLDVIRAHAESLADRTDGDDADVVLTTTDRLAEISTRARRIDQLMTRDPRPTTVDLVSVVTDLLSQIDSDEVTISTDLPGEATLRTDTEILRTTLISPLENAVTYADSSVAVADSYRAAMSRSPPTGTAWSPT